MKAGESVQRVSKLDKNQGVAITTKDSENQVDKNYFVWFIVYFTI